MSLIMDNRLESSNNDKEEEVRKLQELVKKLELQNEELRSERHALLSRNKKDSDSLEKNGTEKAEKETNPVNNVAKEEKSESVENNSGLKLSINLDYHALSDEETWLFDSPKAKANTGWLRKDLNDPSLGDIKKTLVKKLDEITREIDTRTFIRPKKRRSLICEENNADSKNFFLSKAPVVGQRSQNGSREFLAQSSGSLGSEEEDRLSSASDGSYSSYKLTDVEDVNALARLQEESLKLPDSSLIGRYSGMRNNLRGTVNSPTTGTIIPIAHYNNRSKPSTGGSSGNSATSSQEDLLTSPPSGLNHPSPRRTTPTRSGLLQPRRYPSSALPHSASRENSDMSTPPDSPYTSQQNLETYNGKPVGSRLPSMTRRFGGSDPRLLDIHTSPNNSRTSSPQPIYSYRQGSASEVNSVSRSSRLQTPQVRGSRLSAPSPVRIPLGPSQAVDLPYSKGMDSSEGATPRNRQSGSSVVTPSPSSSALPRPGTRLQTPKSRYLPLWFSVEEKMEE
ncbi:SLAIN motif-containing protein 2 [Armadillidium vulgare]|nr:SLAIN motif-containing protein 2 [Armadillidium vulgare]